MADNVIAHARSGERKKNFEPVQNDGPYAFLCGTLAGFDDESVLDHGPRGKQSGSHALTEGRCL